MTYRSDYYDNDNYDPDQSADPCEDCGGNYDGADCESLCDGCDGCPISGGPCHSCTCDHAPSPDEYENRCGNCGGWEKQCVANPQACDAAARQMQEWMFKEDVSIPVAADNLVHTPTKFTVDNEIH